MNPKIIQTQISIAHYEAKLMELSGNLESYTDNAYELGIKTTKENIAMIQEKLKASMELLDVLTDKNDV